MSAAAPIADAPVAEDPVAAGEAVWVDAVKSALLCAVDPKGLGGLSVRAGAGPVRDRLLAVLKDALPQGAPWRKAPPSVPAGRVVGDLDLAATLARGRPVAETGLLAEADGGVLLVPMAERLDAGAAALIGGAMDEGIVRMERGGLSRRDEARFLLVLLDEGASDHEAPPAGLLERSAFRLRLDAIPLRAAGLIPPARDAVAEARARLPSVETPGPFLGALAAASLALGDPSIRRLRFAAAAARASAALEDRGEVEADDVEEALRLVYGARLAPPPEEGEASSQSDPRSGPPPDAPPPEETDAEPTAPSEADIAELAERLIEAVAAGAVAGVIDDLAPAAPARGARGGASGARTKARDRGRPLGARKGDPRRDGRLDVAATLRAAAPWRRLRGAEPGDRIPIRADDLHVKRFEAPAESVVIFVVDASGSAAAARMGEAKGAVETLLADCYARRDEVALVAFRGESAELLLPPTRSLVRAKRALARLPGGGPTPLAAGLVEARVLAEAEAARGRTPFVVLLSDGRGNVALCGAHGRARGQDDALAAARALARSAQVLFFDTSARPDPRAEGLATALAARRRLLPRADAGAISSAVRDVLGPAR